MMKEANYPEDAEGYEEWLEYLRGREEEVAEERFEAEAGGERPLPW